MKELSLHILDIVENSISAKATFIDVYIEENIGANILKIIIRDNGKGIKKEFLKDVLNPFVTTRETRSVGLGLSLFKATADRAKGRLNIKSKENIGTEVHVEMEYDNIDRPPLGSIEDTLVSIISGHGDKVNIRYTYIVSDKKFIFDTIEVKKIICDMDIRTLDIIMWIRDYIREGMENIQKNNL